MMDSRVWNGTHEQKMLPAKGISSENRWTGVFVHVCVCVRGSLVHAFAGPPAMHVVWVVSLCHNMKVCIVRVSLNV